MPAQLAPLELGQALSPLRTRRFAQAALDDPAVSCDHPAAQCQASHAREYKGSHNQDKGETELS
jgi:hypothetical protein